MSDPAIDLFLFYAAGIITVLAALMLYRWRDGKTP
jgi:hypothetical protein